MTSLVNQPCCMHTRRNCCTVTSCHRNVPIVGGKLKNRAGVPSKKKTEAGSRYLAGLCIVFFSHYSLSNVTQLQQNSDVTAASGTN